MTSLILIVLGRPDLRGAFLRHLSGARHRLVFAFEPEDALLRFVEARPDLVLLSTALGVAETAEWCTRMRSLAGGADVPLILLGEAFESGATGERRADELGADGFLVVPFDQRKLWQSLALPLAFGRLPRLVRRSEAAWRASESPPAPSARPREASAPAGGGRISYGLRAPSYASSEELSDDDIPTGLTRAPPLDEPEGPTTLPPGASSSGEYGAGEEPTPTPATLGELAELEAADFEEFETGDRLVSPATDDMPDEDDSEGPGPLLEELPLPDPAELGPKEDVTGSLEAPGGLDESKLGRHLAQRVRQVHGLLEQMDSYALLGVRRNANRDQIKAAFEELSLEFDPQRFALLRSEELAEKVRAILEKARAAYQLLSHPSRRSAYDSALENDETQVPMRPERSSPEELALDLPLEDREARRFVDLARAALSGSDYATARLYLVVAAGYEPNNEHLEHALAYVAELALPRFEHQDDAPRSLNFAKP